MAAGSPGCSPIAGYGVPSGEAAGVSAPAVSVAAGDSGAVDSSPAVADGAAAVAVAGAVVAPEVAGGAGVAGAGVGPAAGVHASRTSIAIIPNVANRSHFGVFAMRLIPPPLFDLPCAAGALPRAAALSPSDFR